MAATISTTKTKPSTRVTSRKPKVQRPKGEAAAASKKAVDSAAAVARRGAATPPGERHQNEGHGRRLTVAFEALEVFPALAESRDRLLLVVSKDHVATADIVTAVESDVALIIAVLRLANRAQQGRGRVDTIVKAVELLTPQTVQAVASRARTFD